MEWIRVEDRRPETADVYAVVCKDASNNLYRLTAYWTGNSWHPLGTMKEAVAEVTHWFALPNEIPPHTKGDPLT